MTRYVQRVKVIRNMKQNQPMPFLIRLWLTLSAYFAPPIHAIAKRSHRRQGSHPDRANERLGQSMIARPTGTLLWVHAASLGEISQTKALIEQVSQQAVNVLVTTVSQSGADWVARELPQVTHQFLPLDTLQAVTGFLDHWQPQTAVFIEGDLWPRLIIDAATRDIPLLLLNARPSKSRDRNPKAFAYLLSHFAAITCKSTQVYDELTHIGVEPVRLHQFGDLRASAAALPHDADLASRLKTQIADRPTWVVASSHAGDETAILRACREVLRQQPNALLIWAPRHPERATDILAATQGLLVARRSATENIGADTQIYLADTLGELGMWFSLATVVFLGGSFGKQGGHNPYEPACFGCVMLTGPKYRNHKDGFSALSQVGAAYVVQDGAALGQEVARLLMAPQTTEFGNAAKALVQNANSAADETAALIFDHLSR